jgi:hypothetical protein
MASRNAPDLDGFLDGLMTTEADRAALLAIRALDRLDPYEYLRFLEAFTDQHPPTREIPPRHEPFVL